MLAKRMVPPQFLSSCRFERGGPRANSQGFPYRHRTRSIIHPTDSVGFVYLIFFYPERLQQPRKGPLTLLSQFCLMSPPPRGKVQMASDNAHYEDLND